jgi:hypothetical protein
MFGPLPHPALAAFAAGIAATALLLMAALAFLLPPLSATLHELCGTRERGQSWVALSCTGLAGGALLASLLGFGFDASPGLIDGRVDGLFWSAVRMVQWATAATLVGLAAIAAIVLAFIAQLGPAEREGAQNQ